MHKILDIFLQIKLILQINQDKVCVAKLSNIAEE